MAFNSSSFAEILSKYPEAGIYETNIDNWSEAIMKCHPPKTTVVKADHLPKRFCDWVESKVTATTPPQKIAKRSFPFRKGIEISTVIVVTEPVGVSKIDQLIGTDICQRFFLMFPQVSNSYRFY